MVVLLPSPSGVGLIAVTRTYLPRARSRLQALDALERDLGLVAAVQLDLVVAEAQLVGDVGDGAGVTERAISRSDGKDIRAGLRHGDGEGVGTQRDPALGLVAGRLHEVGEQDRVGERPDAARDRGDRRGDATGGREVHVARELAVHDVDARRPRRRRRA